MRVKPRKYLSGIESGKGGHLSSEEMAFFVLPPWNRFPKGGLNEYCPQSKYFGLARDPNRWKILFWHGYLPGKNRRPLR